MTKFRWWIPLFPLFMILASCAKVPVSGRRALILVPDVQVSGLASDSYRQLINQSKLSSDPEANALIQRVGKRIAAASDHPGYDWEYNLIDEPKTQNAFCMPGGKVAVYTGILPITKDETGMAVVLGHEVAHAIAKHGAERMSQQLLLTFGEITLDQALSSKPNETRQLANMAFGLSAGLGYVLPYGRMQESEADRIGLIYMARAGYDPRKAIEFWQRMDEMAEGGAPPEFLSTHPSHETRVKGLQKWMSEAVQEYEKTRKTGSISR
jgi:predicted Zn-dependent protease